jgi:hypothetical protein
MARLAALGAVVLAGGFAATPAAASPPPPGSEDYEQLMPYASWISERAANNGGLCCSISDCRVVPFRTQGDQFEAFIARRDPRGFVKFPGGPDRWISVPADVIKHEINPTGRAIACWSAYRTEEGGYYCFFLPDLT